MTEVAFSALRFRRPIWAWAIPATTAAVASGAIGAAIAHAAVTLDWSASRIAVTVLAFAGYALAAALLVGWPWFLATRRTTRPNRLLICLECAGVAATFAILSGATAFGLGWYLDGIGRSGAALGAAAWIAVWGTIWAAPAGALGGLVFAWIMFARTPPPPPSARRR